MKLAACEQIDLVIEGNQDRICLEWIKKERVYNIAKHLRVFLVMAIAPVLSRNVQITSIRNQLK